MQFDKEFKQAISNLPSKEKDKLLTRLLKKDMKLANRLYFELVSEDTVQNRRDEMEKKIIQNITNFSGRYRNGKSLVAELKYASGDIAYHVFVTKDKFGDAFLNAILVREGLKEFNLNISGKTTIGIQHVHIYLINKLYKILIQLNKVHEDYLIEIDDVLEEIEQLTIANEKFAHACIFNGFDLNWFKTVNLPEEIEQTYKSIRTRGYLK